MLSLPEVVINSDFLTVPQKTKPQTNKNHKASKQANKQTKPHKTKHGLVLSTIICFIFSVQPCVFPASCSVTKYPFILSARLMSGLPVTFVCYNSLSFKYMCICTQVYIYAGKYTLQDQKILLNYLALQCNSLHLQNNSLPYFTTILFL